MSASRKSVKRRRDTIQGITKGSLSRLIHDNDLYKNTRLNGLVYEEIRAMLKNHLQDILRVVVLFTQENQKKTVMTKHVYPSLYDIPSSLKKDTKSCTKKNKKEEEEYCFYFAKKSFQNLIRELTYDLDMKLRYSDNALILLQMNEEHYLVSVIKNAMYNMHNGKRTTLLSKDLQAANRQMCDKKLLETISMKQVVDFDIKNMLKVMWKNVSITLNAVEQINTILSIVGQAIVKKANQMIEIDNRTKLSSRTLMYAVHVILPGELSKHAVSEATKVINGENKLILSSSLVEPFVKSFTNTNTNINITKDTYVSLTAVLEYLAAEMLDLSTSASRFSTINSKHIFVAIENDEELNEMISRLHIYN